MKPFALLSLLVVAAAGCAATASAPGAPAAPARSEFPTAPPALGPAPSISLPTPVSRTLPNGLEVLYVQHGTVPLVHATLLVRAGTASDPADLPGLASFAADMLDEGAGGRNALELANALELLGASLTTGATWDASQVELQVLRGRLAEALPLLADVVVRPDFPDAEIRRLREERLTELARARDEATVIAGNAFASLVYGSGHAYGRVPTTEATRRLGRAEVTGFHRGYYRPGNATLLLVGDVDPEVDHAGVVRAFEAWEAGQVAMQTLPAVASSARTTIYLIDKADAPQSEIRIGHPGVQRNSPDYYPLVVLNTLLGGSFTSRLMANLRTQHGYTYGARSSFAMRLGPGPFVAAAAVTTAKTDSAVIEFFRELNRIRDEAIPADELQRAKNYIALGMPRTFETAPQVAARLADVVLYGLGTSYYDTHVERIMAVTAADVQRVARQYLHPDRAAVVVVGDRATVEAGLRALPVGTVEVRRIEEFVP